MMKKRTKRTVQTYKKLICSVCNKGGWKNNIALAMHKRRAHQGMGAQKGANPSQLKRCRVCKKTFKGSMGLAIHMRRIHGNQRARNRAALLDPSPKRSSVISSSNDQVNYCPRCGLNIGGLCVVEQP